MLQWQRNLAIGHSDYRWILQRSDAPKQAYPCASSPLYSGVPVLAGFAITPTRSDQRLVAFVPQG
jgi:hypothetical protein